MEKAFCRNIAPIFITTLCVMLSFAMPIPAAAAEAISGFVYIQPGSFQMGSISGFADEQPRHSVTISTGFYIGITEVTQKEWYDVMGTKPWLTGSVPRDYVKAGDSYPATYVSWNDIQGFIDAKNAEGVYYYRLPTEAEWEYACRAGTATVFSFGDDAADLGTYAWYRDNAWEADEDWPHQVKTKAANPWGLYDMHGNVWEWCQDWYSEYPSDAQTDPTGPAEGDAKVIRGGSFMSFDVIENGCTSSNRNLKKEDYAWADTGFRLVIATNSNDSDGDGVPNDKDDFPDDPSKATIAAAPGTGKITIAVTSPAGAKLTNIAVLSDTDASLNATGKPADYTFPHGLISFKVKGLELGATATVTLTFPAKLASDSVYYKVDDDGFHSFAGASFSGSTVTLTLTDGGDGDEDGTANGTIVEPGGPAAPSGGGNGGGGGGGGGGCFINTMK